MQKELVFLSEMITIHHLISHGINTQFFSMISQNVLFFITIFKYGMICVVSIDRGE